MPVFVCAGCSMLQERHRGTPIVYKLATEIVEPMRFDCINDRGIAWMRQKGTYPAEVFLDGKSTGRHPAEEWWEVYELLKPIKDVKPHYLLVPVDGKKYLLDLSKKTRLKDGRLFHFWRSKSERRQVDWCKPNLAL